MTVTVSYAEKPEPSEVTAQGWGAVQGGPLFQLTSTQRSHAASSLFYPCSCPPRTLYRVGAVGKVG